MSEAPKHTPAPWTAEEQTSRAGVHLGWIVNHSNGRIGWSSLAYATPNKAADAGDPAIEANAHLIAASPELLEALKAALPVIDDAFLEAREKAQDMDNGSRWTGVAECFRLQVEHIRAVVSRAEGREP